MFTHAGRYPRRPEKGVESPGAGVRGNCKPPNIRTRNRITSLEASALTLKVPPDKLFLRNHIFLSFYSGLKVKPICTIQYE